MKILLAILALASTALAAPQVGQPLPKLAGLLPGAKLPATVGKVVLVDFWASWCGPCKASFPALNRLHDKYSGKGLVIIGIGLDEDPKDHRKFVSEMGTKFYVVHDAKQKAADFFSVPMMPFSYLVDRKGVIRYIHHQGFNGAKSEAQYTKEIESLLK